MALMLLGFDVDNYDQWKQVFDTDPAGRRAVANGHRISRSVDNPNEIFVSVEYPSTDEAKAALGRLQEAGVLEQFRRTLGPTIAEIVEQETY